MKKVRIKQLPVAKKGMEVNGLNASFFKYANVDDRASQESHVQTTLKPVPRDKANLEAEKGEVVVGDINYDTIPEFYRVGGQPHYNGGTPLSLPDNSFIFSKDKKMRIKDEDMLSEFGKKPRTKGYTPAELAMQYDLNDYRKQLQDPDSDPLMVNTAEKMIENYNMKLAKLALAQESSKGFPQGIPAIAMPYFMMNNVDPATLVASPNTERVPDQQPVAKHGLEIMNRLKFQSGGQKTLMTAPKRGDRVVYNPETGQNEVYNWRGEFKGVLPGQNAQQNTPAKQVAKTTAAPTKVQNIPEGATKHDESASAYNAAAVKPGDYIKKGDGRWYRATGYKTKPYTGNFQDPRLQGAAGDLQEAYGRLEQTLTDPNNADLRKALINQYRSNMAKVKPNSRTGMTKADIDAAKAMSDDEVLNNFLEMQKQVMATNAHGISGKNMDPNDSWDKKRTNYEQTITQLGFKPLNKSQQAAFQGAYVSLQNIADDSKYKDALADYRVSQVGVADEPGGGTGRATISDIDGWVGNTTIGQAALYKPTLKELDIKEVPDTEIPAPEEKTPTLPGDIGPLKTGPRADWWLQDVVKTAGAAMDMARIKKYMPWAPTFQPVVPDPTFYDPTRELAANAEQMAIGTEGTAMFAGPQAFSARFSGIQGAGARNAADTLARYNNMNVGVANLFAGQQAGIMNQASQMNLGLADELYDQTTIVNQQFDNAKAMARQNLRQSYIDAISNRANAQVMNSLYPQYNISPISGGMMNFVGGKKLKPIFGQQQNVMDVASDYMSQYPGFNPQQYYDAAKVSMGMPSAPFGNAPDAEYYDQYAQMMAGVSNPMMYTP